MTARTACSSPERPGVRLLAACLLLLGLLTAAPAGAVPKTDVITLINGDIITCEIKEMSRGKLRVKTDDMDTIYIKWDKIARVTSSYWFLVSFKNGTLVFGQMLDSGQDSFVVVKTAERSLEVGMEAVVEIQPVRKEFWDKLDFSVAWGFNWTKASQVVQSNFDASGTYNGRIYRWGLTLSSIITDRGEGEVTRRNDGSLFLGRDISGRLNGQINTGLSRNDELGLRRRFTGGANLGYFLVRSNHMDLLTQLGASLNREWATEDAPPQNNAELHVGAAYTVFRYDSPKTDLTLTADLYPNLTQKDRTRFEFNAIVRQEIVKDLFVRVRYYESQDTNPPPGANAKEDRGLAFSIEWSK
jgi:Holliday junction resolvase